MTDFKRLITPALLFLCVAGAVHALRPYSRGAEAKTCWMTVSSLTDGNRHYMEVAADGKMTTRAETKTSVFTRRGSIPQQLAKDFFREVETSEVIASQAVKANKLIFYKGEILGISAYVNGELRRVESPLNNFGEAFSHAFAEVRKASEKMPVEKELKGFLTAEPLGGAELDEFRAKASKEGEVKTIETYDIQKAGPLMSAVKQPYRLVSLDNDAAVKKVRDFISAKRLYGIRGLFYLPSTRGTFKCRILDARK